MKEKNSGINSATNVGDHYKETGMVTQNSALRYVIYYIVESIDRSGIGNVGIYQLETKKMLYLVIENETPPSWNKLYAGMHWGKRKQIADHWHELVKYSCIQQKIPMVKYNGRGIQITTSCFFKNRRLALDADNICDKVIIDGLKETVIGDDDYKHVKQVTTRTNVDATHPRTEIIISWI